MRRLMPVHNGSTFGVVPPRDAIYPLIDIGELHWLWNGDFYDDHEARYASYSWSPRIDRPATTYIVARVVWEHARNESLFRRKLFNECGLLTCVNPAHYSVPAVAGTQRWALPSPCVLSDGAVARVVHRDQVNHIRYDDGRLLVCGLSNRMPVTIEPDTSLVTCASCLYVWQALGRLLVAV